ncbi:CoA transferase subunit A [Vibrio marisflavi]|uniref:Butyrate--acetoacetate CoA-transferase subunit A n=1 Tax=Vibrio marisflavi CECT 7928 TaxID=634439 RepID=A0ABN8E142_9VIBR|nr:3-oxoacid CoA-transferase subunit A [Vibrio marisflavi]CAH0537117.1 Butyrate--acetoacetate CoA-transferase subunit A [Vibrio marisflavi CECT 7928]
MNKLIDKQRFLSLLRDDMTIMVGGFMANGAPETLINLVVKSGVQNITLISTDTAIPNKGVSKLIASKQVSKLLASHIGLNPETGVQMNQGSLDVELVPQGTLAERIRSGGAGLGGVLTKTGLGTIVAEGKQTLAIGGEEYLLELPLKADLALIRGSKIDSKGNIFYNKTTRNFNSLMATAADIVVAEAEHLVALGDIQAESVHTPSLFVDHILEGIIS